MPVLNAADALYLGARPVDVVHLGDTLVWPSAPPPLPATIPGLAVWLEADTLALLDGATVTAWPNPGSDADPTVINGPVLKTGVTPNGMPAVRFNSTSRLRGTIATQRDYTIVYIARRWGPTNGRCFTAPYPEGANFLLGYHITTYDCVHDDGGWLVAGTPYPETGTDPWRLYSADNASGFGVRAFFDGVLRGGPGTVGGGNLANRYNINGYSITGAEECGDFDVPALIVYDRKLSDAERTSVEGYLRDKWLTVSSFDPDTQAFLDATGLDASYAPALDGLVVGLKDAGLWNKMRAVYPFIGGTEHLHKWNLKDPRDLDAAYRLSFHYATTISHSDELGWRPNDQGWVANGGYADTHLVPLGVLDVNSTHLAYYSLADVPPISRCEIGCYAWAPTDARFHIIARYTPSEFYYGQCEDAGASHVSVPSSAGLFVATRTAANAQDAYRNGVRLGGNQAGPNAGLPPVPVHVGAINHFNDRSDLPCGFASVGDGLSALNVADLNTVVQAYQAALGRVPVFRLPRPLYGDLTPHPPGAP